MMNQFHCSYNDREREREMNLPLAQGIGPDTRTGFTALWTDQKFKGKQNKC